MKLDPLVLQLLLHYGQSLDGSPTQLLQYTLAAFSRIPYENLSKIVRYADSSGSRHKESPHELIQGFIRYGSGGTCFSLTHALVYLLRSFEFEAHPILADRRYGQDTHCAVIFRERDEQWQLLDPGYLIHSPCLIPRSGAAHYELPLSSIELRSTTGNQVELYTTTLNSSGSLSLHYRLTYRLNPIEPDEFLRAWDRSFDWEMMTYPIVSAYAGDMHLYLQKKTLLLRSRDSSTRVTLSNEEIVKELASHLSLSQDVIRRALTNLST